MRATEETRSATGVAVAPSSERSPHRVSILLDYLTVEPHLQGYRLHVGGRHDTLVNCQRGQLVLFSKDVQPPSISDEAYYLVAPFLGPEQRMPRGRQRHGKTNLCLAFLQGHFGCLSFQFAIAVSRVVLLLEVLRLPTKISLISHQHAAKKAVLMMVIKFLHHPVAPRPRQRNKPRLDSVQQAISNQQIHASNISLASIKSRLVVHLNVVKNLQEAPTRPDRIRCMLSGFAHYRPHGASSCRQVYAVQALEAVPPLRIARTEIIHLAHKVRALPEKLQIFSLFQLPSLRATLRQFLPSHNAVDGSERRTRMNLPLFQLPDDGLGSAKQVLVAQVKSKPVSSPRRFRRTVVAGWYGDASAAARSQEPRNGRPKMLDPFVGPTPTIPNGIGDD